MCLVKTLILPEISQGRAKHSIVKSSEKTEAHRGERDEHVRQRGLALSWDHISKENFISCCTQ